jgi:hypothetical protein
MEHVYLVANCKGAGCSAALVLKYVGLRCELGDIGNEFVPTDFVHQCGECKETNHYKREDVCLALFDCAPSSGFQDAF